MAKARTRVSRRSGSPCHVQWPAECTVLVRLDLKGLVSIRPEQDRLTSRRRLAQSMNVPCGGEPAIEVSDAEVAGGMCGTVHG
jgi:hypothetical protein